MAKLNLNKPEIVWLVFQNHNMSRITWWEKFEYLILSHLKVGFSHVYVVKKGLNGTFIIIDAYSSSLAIYEINRPSYIQELRFSGLTVIEAVTRDCDVHPRGLITCVSIAKYLLGIRKLGIITPYQLFKYLTKE